MEAGDAGDLQAQAFLVLMFKNPNTSGNTYNYINCIKDKGAHTQNSSSTKNLTEFPWDALEIISISYSCVVGNYTMASPMHLFSASSFMASRWEGEIMVGELTAPKSANTVSPPPERPDVNSKKKQREDHEPLESFCAPSLADRATPTYHMQCERRI